MLEQDLSIDMKEYATAMKDILLKKDNRKFVELMERILGSFHSRDYIKLDESHVKLAAFIISCGFSYIIPKTEYAIGKRYLDLVLLPQHVVGATALIEFHFCVHEAKYIKKKEFTEQLLEEKKQEAKEQLDYYTSAKEFQSASVVAWSLVSHSVPSVSVMMFVCITVRLKNKLFKYMIFGICNNVFICNG